MENQAVVDEFINWVNKKYGSIQPVKASRGRVHDYLGMKLNYSIDGQVSIDMSDYVEKMLSNFPEEDLKGARVASPWGENLFRW